MSALEHKIAYSIALLRRGEALALRMSPDGYHLAFSGGKDSMRKDGRGQIQSPHAGNNY